MYTPAALGTGIVLLAACVARAASGGSLTISVSTSDSVYRPDAPVEARLEVSNAGATPVVLHFSSGQRYDFLVVNVAGDTAWRWAGDKAFLQMLSEEPLRPGDSLRYAEAVAIPLAAGRYTLVGRLTSRSHPLEGRLTFTVR